MGFLSKLFGKNSQKTDLKKPLTPEMVDKIIQDYGYVLENEAPRPGTVADQNKLPYPKEQIKQALIVEIRCTDNEIMKETLKFAFESLACWQEGVGEENQGLDLSKLDLNGDPEEVFEKIKKQKNSGKNWTEILAVETESLAQELQELGL